MASSIGDALRRHCTVRPVLVRITRPASDSTSRCFITAGSDIGIGAANSLIERLSASPKRANSARRVGSDSAAKVRLSATSRYLTMKLSIGGYASAVKARHARVRILNNYFPLTALPYDRWRDEAMITGAKKFYWIQQPGAWQSAQAWRTKNAKVTERFMADTAVAGTTLMNAQVNQMSGMATIAMDVAIARVRKRA